MSKYLLKICGVRQPHEAAYCEDLGVDFMGVNFVETSKRLVSVEQAKLICGAVVKIKKVGVFRDQALEYVNSVAEEVGLDFVQLHGGESLDFVRECNRPVIKGLSVEGNIGEIIEDGIRMIEGGVKFVLFDGVDPGSGQGFDYESFGSRLRKMERGGKLEGRFLVAGGVNEENVQDILRGTGAAGVDVASGVETLGQVDLGKIKVIYEEIKLLEQESS